MREYVLNAAKESKQPVVLRATPARAALEHCSRGGTRLKEGTSKEASVATWPTTRISLLSALVDEDGDIWGIRRSAARGVDLDKIHLPTLLKVIIEEKKDLARRRQKFLDSSDRALDTMPPAVREAAELLTNWVDSSLSLEK